MSNRACPLIVLSVDGMRPDFYLSPERFGLRVPNLRRLVASGTSAEKVESVCPTTTYPAHATLVTGVPPRVHGVYSHLASRDPTEVARAWNWFASAIRVPTLWDAARAAGLKTSAVTWPVTAGAAIDYNIPEIWNPAAPDPNQDFGTVGRYATPAGLFGEVLKAIQPLLSESASEPKLPGNSLPGGQANDSLDRDDITTHVVYNMRLAELANHPELKTTAVVNVDTLRSEAALYLWRRYRPDLLLVHFVSYDQAAHRWGPLSPEALSAIEESDTEIGRILESVADRQVTVIVLSDHGFVPVEREAAPLAALAEEGLFDRNADGTPKLKRLGAIHAGGSFAVYWLERPSPGERAALSRAVERLCGAGAIAEVLAPPRLAELEADPDAELMLDAAPGHYFSDRFDGPLVRDSQKDRGTHGQLPSRPGLEASFIAAGPGIVPGHVLRTPVRLTQVAPTLARCLGLPAESLPCRVDPLDLWNP